MSSTQVVIALVVIMCVGALALFFIGIIRAGGELAVRAFIRERR